MGLATKIKTASRRLLRHAARPVRQDEGAEGLVVEPYRGFGSRSEVYLIGRVFRQPGGPAPREAGDLRVSLRRLVRRGAARQTIAARFAGAEQHAVTDGDGYFRLHLRLEAPPPDGLWHRVPLRLELPSGREARATGEVFVPTAAARFVVISDIDDTVMLTGVAAKMKMFWRLFAQGARSRVAFPGVAALYRALHGSEQNPILYVSRGPWSIYSMLETFFQMHRIPVGPILFLREWGVSLRSPLPRRARDHKLDLIRNMLELYGDLPFLLIGDSGQHDPETYAQIVRENPGRVLAVFIRNVSHRGSARAEAIEALAEEVLEAGSSLLLAADSTAMAERAAALDLIPRSAISAVADEQQSESGRRRVRAVRTLRRQTRAQTQEAVARGELEQTLDETEEPPSALVESEADRERGQPARSEQRR
jgi:phosphatidate phosphatase APP1